MAEIVAGGKKVEYRQMKAYWDRRLKGVSIPFELRLINGMRKHAPEATVLIDKVRRNATTGNYELHIHRVLGFRNWDKRRCRPRVAQPTA